MSVKMAEEIGTRIYSRPDGEIAKPLFSGEDWRAGEDENGNRYLIECPL